MAQTTKTKVATKAKVAAKRPKPAATAPAKVAKSAAPAGAVIGYARTSTVDQAAGLEAQQRDLEAAGCSKVFAEKVSSIGKRDQLAAALDYLRDGDTLTVTKPDRLARSVPNLLDIIAELDAKGVSLRVLSMNGGAPLNAKDPTARLTLTVLGAVAEFERAMMLERQKEGIAKARSEGRYMGRKATARAKSADVLRLHAERVGATEIAERLGIGRASVYRVLKSAVAT